MLRGSGKPVQGGPASEQSSSKDRAQKPATGQEAVKGEKLRGEERRRKTVIARTQTHRVCVGREVPRGGGDEPETNHPASAVFTHLSFISTRDARALASEGKLTETEENSLCTDLTPYHQPYGVPVSALHYKRKRN